MGRARTELRTAVPEPGTGCRFDPQVAIAQALPSVGVMMNLGVRRDTIVYSGENGWISFTIGSGRRQAFVIYTADDLYTVEVRRWTKATEFVVEAQEVGVFGDQLPDALIRMHDVAVSR